MRKPNEKFVLLLYWARIVSEMTIAFGILIVFYILLRAVFLE